MPEKRRLRKDVGAAQARGMLVVTFNLGGTSEVTLHQNRARISAQCRRGRVEHRDGRARLLPAASRKERWVRAAAWCSPSYQPSPGTRPSTCRKPRRETESTHSEAPFGNSRCSISWNSGVPASSSRLRQYSGPWVCAICASTVARSSFLPGQTASPFVLCFASSIFYVGGSLPPIYPGLTTDDRCCSS